MNEKQIDDIVSMLDQFMSGDGGHMNITVTPDGKVMTEKTLAKTVKTTPSLDCASGDLACNVPTLFEGIENEEESEADDSAE